MNSDSTSRVLMLRLLIYVGTFMLKKASLSCPPNLNSHVDNCLAGLIISRRAHDIMDSSPDSLVDI